MNLLRELTRLKSISSTPIIQKFKEGLEGVSTIRIFNKYDSLFDQYLSKVDDFQKNAVTVVGANNWFNVRVSLLALMVIIPTIWISVSLLNLILLAFRCQYFSGSIWTYAQLHSSNDPKCQLSSKHLQ